MASNKMENMDLDQTTIQNVEGATSYLSKKRVKQVPEDTLVPSSDLKDATSYPPNKRVKHDVLKYLEEEEAVIEWSHMLNFQHYHAKGTKLVFEDVVSEYVKEIDARKKSLDKALYLLTNNFGDLKEKRLCPETSSVIRCFHEVHEAAWKCLQAAYDMLPDFKKYVEDYVNHVNGPLASFHLAEDQYFYKLGHLAETPHFEELIKELLYDNDKKIEHHCVPTQSDIHGMIDFLRENKYIISHAEEDEVKEEQYGEMGDLNEAVLKDLSSSRNNYVAAEKIVKENVKKCGYGVVDFVCPIECCLCSVDFKLRIIRQQLKLLIKDVRNKGYAKDFKK